ncbi:MAG: ACT domain-containing protein, partial [Planctomycetota bacterium]
MYIATQFSVFMVNKPGVLAQVLGELARAKINVIAITMMDSVEHGVMR